MHRFIPFTTSRFEKTLTTFTDLGVMPDVDTAVGGTAMRHPIGRMGRADEMGGGVVFLCSEAASFMTCDELVIDGGFASV